MKKGFILLIIFCLVILLVPGCSGNKSNKGDTIKIGITIYDRTDAFLSELISEIRENVEKIEKSGKQVSISVRDSKGSQRLQNDQVEELIDEGCDVLCINLTDRADPSEIIDMARNSEIPIIFYNREPVMEDLMQWDKVYYVGANARQSGQLQGELASEYINSHPEVDRNQDGKIQYVLIEGEPGHQDAIIRTDASVETILSHGIELEKISYQIANWNRAQAQNRMTQLITQYHNQIEMILANNDEMALGALDAYDKSNYSEGAIPIVFGVDGTKDGTDAVESGRLTGTVYNDKEGQAEVITSLAMLLAEGESIDCFEFENGKCIYLNYRKIQGR